MQQWEITKVKFSETNDKIFYNLNGVTSFPIGHPYLKELTSYKESKGEKIEKKYSPRKGKSKKVRNRSFC